MEINQEDPITVVKVKYELPRDRDDFWLFYNAPEMRSCLCEISSRCRTAYKYGENQEIAAFAEEIQKIIYEELNLDEL